MQFQLGRGCNSRLGITVIALAIIAVIINVIMPHLHVIPAGFLLAIVLLHGIAGVIAFCYVARLAEWKHWRWDLAKTGALAVFVSLGFIALFVVIGAKIDELCNKVRPAK